MNKKIIIIGDQGRGKSTMAKKLSDISGILYHSTDDYFYEIKYSKVRDKQESIESISKNYDTDAWIVEGSTQHLLKPGLAKADVIIYLKHKSILHQYVVVIKRHFSRRHESLSDLYRLLKHIFYKRYGLYKGKLSYEERLAPYADKVVTLNSFKEIQKFIFDFPKN